jgi:hypothetical protein
MNSMMSGWSASRITILAARRVLPPLLITPAKASKPRMNDTGPEAMPPPSRRSMEPRNGDRLLPVPEPPLNSIPSVLARVRMLSMESSTALMKQAEHWGFSLRPQLNQTGLLKLAFWCSSRWVSSAAKASRWVSPSK